MTENSPDTGEAGETLKKALSREHFKTDKPTWKGPHKVVNDGLRLGGGDGVESGEPMGPHAVDDAVAELFGTVTLGLGDAGGVRAFEPMGGELQINRTEQSWGSWCLLVKYSSSLACFCSIAMHCINQFYFTVSASFRPLCKLHCLPVWYSKTSGYRLLGQLQSPPS